METKDEIRRRRLQQVCDLYGGERKVAEMAGLATWQTLTQILRGTPLPPKKDGTRSEREVGDNVARKIEDAFNLGTGWFDWPLDKVDYLRYWSLEADDRAYVQAKMMSAIEERERASNPNQEQAQDPVKEALEATQNMTKGKKKPNGGRKAA